MMDDLIKRIDEYDLLCIFKALEPALFKQLVTRVDGYRNCEVLYKLVSNAYNDNEFKYKIVMKVTIFLYKCKSKGVLHDI